MDQPDLILILTGSETDQHLGKHFCVAKAAAELEQVELWAMRYGPS